MKNRIDDPVYKDQITDFRKRMAEHLKRSEDPMAEVFDVYQKTHSVDRLVETYAAMWENHGIPGRIASNPVNRSKWEDSEEPQSKTPNIRSETRRRRRQRNKTEQNVPDISRSRQGTNK